MQGCGDGCGFPVWVALPKREPWRAPLAVAVVPGSAKFRPAFRPASEYYYRLRRRAQRSRPADESYFGSKKFFGLLTTKLTGTARRGRT